MTTRDRPRDLGRARGLRLLQEFGREVREARRSAGLSQAMVASVGGVSRSTISELEQGRLADLSIVRMAALAGVVGLDLRVRTYAGVAAVRDAAQIRLLERLINRLGDAWEWRFEVPIGRAPDQRAWDAVGRHRVTGQRIVVEAITRLTDVQATLRRIESKRVDAGSPRLLVILSESVANRLAMEAAGTMLDATFLVGKRRALRALATGGDPGGDAVMMI